MIEYIFTSRNKLFYVLLACILTLPAVAKPPFQVLRSCIDEAPYNAEVTIKDINNGYYIPKPLENCTDEFQITFQKRKFSAVNCGGKKHLIIAQHKIALEEAKNLSVNPHLKPGGFIADSSLWLKIDFAQQSYLCLNGPISETGVGAANNQYYIIENAFSDTSAPVIYYYFLNKDLHPVTS